MRVTKEEVFSAEPGYIRYRVTDETKGEDHYVVFKVNKKTSQVLATKMEFGGLMPPGGIDPTVPYKEALDLALARIKAVDFDGLRALFAEPDAAEAAADAPAADVPVDVAGEVPNENAADTAQ